MYFKSLLIAFQGLHKNLIVRNYPLLPITRQEAEELAMAQAERKISLAFESSCSQMQQEALVLQQEIAATPRGPNSVRGTSLSSRQNSRDHTPSPRAGGSGHSRRGGASSADQEASAKPKDPRFMGSLSHKFIGMDGVQQLEQRQVTTRLQIMHQLTLLKVRKFWF